MAVSLGLDQGAQTMNKRYRYTCTVIINGVRCSLEQAAKYYEIMSKAMVRGG